MMKSFETVYKELEELFIQRLPEYIEKINKEYNDGIVLKRFENHTLTEDCIKLPSFYFSLEESEYTEKDRIIENSIYTVSFEILLAEYQKDRITILWRYVESINRMFEEIETDNIFKISEIKESKIFIRIIL
ncbi:MAG: hypothetical protein J5527_11015 [Treponema sp.]|nr:hypothetical protein [Treponema sp.]